LLISCGPGWTSKDGLQNLTSTALTLLISGSGWRITEYQHSRKPWTLAVIQLRHPTITYYLIFWLTLLNSCDLGLTECKDIKEWKLDKYRFVKSDCIGPVGPRYYPISVYIDDKEQLGNASQIDSCTFTWQADNESYLTFNICVGTTQERKPNKIPLDRKTIDSVTIYSNEFKQTQLLTNTQIEYFVADWNNSKTRGYYPEEPFDSAFSVFPAYQFRLTVFSKGKERPFYAYNYILLDSSNWKYEMSKIGDLNYIHNYWRK
jgi:hypothetical protein